MVMMVSGMQEPDHTSADISRPAKRRRFYRRRTDTEEDEAPHTSGPQAVTIQELQTIDELVSQSGHTAKLAIQPKEAPLSVADLIRQRKAIQRRRGGIEFTNLNPATSATDAPQPSTALVEKDDTPADIKSVTGRFAPQTGQVSEATDRHMMAYIDSELAKRDRQNQIASTLSHNGQRLSQNGALFDAGIQRQPAALGKLHEIDLGPDATLRNIAQTEAAQRKLEGIEPEIDEKTGKLRLRRDGKPYGWRKRRNSNDVKRDKLVEEVMRESKLEIYDEPEDEGPNDDQAADDRIAEQFRREFMDAISSRKQKAVQDKKPVRGQPVDDRPKGPKLGGSRSARAAMREKEEAAAKKR